MESGFVSFIDRTDQQADDSTSWLHTRKRQLLMDVSCFGEQEKACIDVTAPASSNQFSRVYAVHSRSKVPVTGPFHEGSPSKAFSENPFIMRLAAESSFRLQVNFSLGTLLYGSGFQVSPNFAITAGHLVRKRPLKGEIQHIKICTGNLALSTTFANPHCCSSVLEHDDSFAQEHDGLYSCGADIGVLLMEKPSNAYLLPCSSSFLTDSQRHIAVLSFPAVSEYILKAEYELQGSGTDIWDAYKFVMQPQVSCIAKIKNVPEDHPSVVREAKLLLLDMLNSTFGMFSTGQMLCSVGVLVDDNGISASTSCSTLVGSSGAAICSLQFPGYYIAVHSGGMPGFGTNIASSCDNPTFVSWFNANVMDDLPGLDAFKNIQVEPFLHWLSKHSATTNPRWLSQVKPSKKRPREDSNDEL